jgi:3-hydroxy-9,10-secoandrosta-1,3,5(10)-triene-9,17-dione monooxygenase reductase component
MHPCPPVDLPAEAPAEAPEPGLDASGLDGEALREAMRRVASPVVVVTAEPPGKPPRGATIGSFTSVALEPPLVSFNVTQGTRLHAALKAARRFAVHLLAADQADVAAHFAELTPDGEAQFAPYAPARPGRGAPPVLGGTLGVLLCRRERCYEAGDHTVFVGRVVEVVPGREAPPLVYHAREYRTVG